MANQPTLHEMIAAHPSMAHSVWAAQHPEATLQERDLMLKRFQRIGQQILEDWNRHRPIRPEPKSRYLIPGEPGFSEENFWILNQPTTTWKMVVDLRWLSKAESPAPKKRSETLINQPPQIVWTGDSSDEKEKVV